MKKYAHEHGKSLYVRENKHKNEEMRRLYDENGLSSSFWGVFLFLVGLWLSNMRNEGRNG